MKTTAVRPEIAKVAEQYFDENKADFVQNLAERVQAGIENAESQKARGEFMDLATFEQKLYAIDLSK